jgi:hypothetical protein
MTKVNFKEKQSEFVLQQCLINSINAAFRLRRAGSVYSKSEDKSAQLRLRQDFAIAIVKAAKKVINAQTDQQGAILIRAIDGVVNGLEKKHKATLAKGQISFGVAQKALNLFLKYLWGLGLSPYPPHCPIDSQVLKEINWEKEIKKGEEKTWPFFDKQDYKKAVNLILKNSQSIAEWELEVFKPSIGFSDEEVFGDKFSVFSKLSGNR